MPDPYKHILYRVEERIARITLNAPEKRNALSFLMRDEIVNALRTAEADDGVSVVLIDGAGPSFCSGYDMTAGHREHKKDGWVHSPNFDGWTDQFARSCLRDWLTIWDLLKPVVVKAHGHCVAGGTEILSMADIAFVAEDARIGYPPMRTSNRSIRRTRSWASARRCRWAGSGTRCRRGCAQALASSPRRCARAG
jgi:enoyl-CoA hydratase